MHPLENENRELRRLIRDLVALAATPAAWVGRGPAHIADGAADTMLHTLRADAVLVVLTPGAGVEGIRQSGFPGFKEQVLRVLEEIGRSTYVVETASVPDWPAPLRIAIHPLGISAEYGFIAVGSTRADFPQEAESLLLSVAANQTSVALQATRLRTNAETERSRFAELLAQAPAAIGLLTGPELRWTYVNDNYIQVTGRRSAADFLGRTVRESLPEIETQQFVDLLRGVYQTGRPYVGREVRAYLNRAHSGQPEECYFDFVYQPVRNGEGVVDGVLVYAVEVTEKVLARQRIEQNEQRLRAIVETTPECVKLVAQDGTLLQMNAAGLMMVGASCADTVLGTNIYDVIAPEDRGRFQEFNEAICRGERGTLEFDIISLTGERRHMETHAAPLGMPDGSQVQLAVTRDVSERRQAELALRESEQRFRVVTEASPIMVWMSGTDKLCYWFNKGWLEFVGRTMEQECGNGWAENVHPDDFERCLEIYVENFDARQPFEMEYRLKHHSGQYRWIIDHGVPRFAPDGTFEGYVGGCLDIHDRKEAAEQVRLAAEALRESEEQFRTLANSMPQLVWMANADGWIFWYNDGWYKYTGTTPEAMEGWGWQSVHDPKVLPSVMERWKHSIATGERFDMTFPLRGADGNFRPFLTRVTPLRDARGNITRWFGTNTDVSNEVEILERLQRALIASQRLAAIVESTDDAILSKDLNSNVTSWNPAAERIFGYSSEEMVGQSVLKIIPPEMRADEGMILEKIGRGERIQHVETIRLTKNGERIEVSLTVSPVKDESGRIVGAATIARDITQRKKAERALRTTERLAAVGRLAATVAHEINNPLEAVTNLVYLAKRVAVREDVKEYLAGAEEELERVAQLTRQTLGFYRETKGVSPVQVGAAVQSLVAVFASRARNKGADIKLEIKEDVEVMAVPGEIRQLVGNLLSNSVDAIEKGGRIRIRISRKSSGGAEGVQLTVADDGPGIPLSARPHIFEAFFTTKKEVGTGLGLWVCKGIVEKHGGRIRVRSSARNSCSGTVFTVFLPAEMEEVAEEALRQAV